MFAALHAASRWFENFADRHQHGIAALSALATTAAVVVALRASRQAHMLSQPRLRARVTAVLFGYGDGRTETSPYIALRLDNVGNVPIRLNSTCFSWRVPFSGSHWWLVMPVDEFGDQHISARDYPFTMKPHTSDNVFLTPLETFENDMMPRILGAGRLPKFVAARLIRGYVYVDGGSQFRADLDGNLHKHIRVAVARPGTGDHKNRG
jgi:hypothetical protein